MPSTPRTPPRFVPTLTEVVQVPEAPSLSEPQPPGPVRSLAEPLSARAGESRRVAPATTASLRTAVAVAPETIPAPGQMAASPLRPAPVPRLPDGTEEAIIHRVMQRVDVVLDQRLREAIATVVQEQTRSLLPRLREEIESVARHAVYEAVADELAGGHTPQLSR